jgi:hypothetical protein
MILTVGFNPRTLFQAFRRVSDEWANTEATQLPLTRQQPLWSPFRGLKPTAKIKCRYAAKEKIKKMDLNHRLQFECFHIPVGSLAAGLICAL